MSDTPTVTLLGRITTKEGPLEGIIWFVPRGDLWYADRGIYYGVAGGHRLLSDGAFNVRLSPDVVYDVYSPVGNFKITMPHEGVAQLADLVPKKAA